MTPEAPTRAELSACVECGLCLPHCPTFRLTGDESASPRGRLAAMVAVAGGNALLDETFEDMMGFCLQCRACEAACPSLVPFGRVMEGARIEVAAQRPSFRRSLRHLAAGLAVTTPRLLRLAARATALARRLGMDRVVPPALRLGMSGLRSPAPGTIRGANYPATGAEVGTVTLLAGCVMDAWFGRVHEASIQLLRRAGYRVAVPAEPACCGALAAHDGDRRRARRLAIRNVQALSKADLVVADAAGCGAHLRDYGVWAGDGGSIVAGKSHDITEVVSGAIEAGRLPRLPTNRGRVAVQEPCHLRHAQRVVEAPRAILRAAGYSPTDLGDDQCCGAAGLYMLLRPETARRLGEHKATLVREAGTTIVASANPGCELQLRAHLEGWYRVAHPVELYWEALVEDQGRGVGRSG